MDFHETNIYNFIMEIFLLQLCLSLFEARVLFWNDDGPRWYIYPSFLLYKEYMINPHSWIHFLFLRRNNCKNIFHIKPIVILLFDFYISSIIDLTFGGLIWSNNSLAVNYPWFAIISYIILIASVLIWIIVAIWLFVKSKSLFLKERAMKQNEYEILIKEIENSVPGFFYHK
ncbi:MAG: hypothetical protein PHW22_04755 [Bacilli bacterium]|nr:hypothetical protein [Bacilli bacterium]